MSSYPWGVMVPYFGAKFMRGKKYPAPRYDHIVEPFCGGAGYSLRYPDLQVTLVDKSEHIAGVWDFLIKASEEEILRLPLMGPGQDVQTLAIPQEAQWLLGFWINQGSSAPKRTMGRKSNQRFGTWTEHARARLAGQVERISHWTIIHGDYTDAPDVEATWFIDSPYQGMGKHYKHKIEDFSALGSWSRSRQGQVMVCEGPGADWLPFEPVTTVVGSSHRKVVEYLWTNGDPDE